LKQNIKENNKNNKNKEKNKNPQKNLIIPMAKSSTKKLITHPKSP
jgi:hypothetical protein